MQYMISAIIGLMLFTFSAEPAAAKRVALVIGNGDYKVQGGLVNPPNDAKLLGESLARAKFEIIDTKTNLGIAEFRQALRRFQAQANGADVALVYFAGHGIEANGANWLIPTDAELAEDRDLDYEAIKADLVLQALQGAKMRVLVLDACRNNPFGRGWRTGVRNTGSGLGKIEADDVLVLFAAAPGRTASDGTGAANSPFATALAKRLPEPGLSIQYLGGSVRDDVLASTGGVQRPYVSASITGRPFYLVPAEAVTKPAENTSGAAPAPKGLNAEEQKFFDSCVKLTPHMSRETVVSRLATLYQSGSHTYGWKYDPPAANLNAGDFAITAAETLANGVLQINYSYRWGRLFLMPVNLSSARTRGLSPRDTGVQGASLQLHGMWVQDSGHGCVVLYMNGETGEAAGEWQVTDDAGKSLNSINRIEKVAATANPASTAKSTPPKAAPSDTAAAPMPPPDMVDIPAGQFSMGSPASETGRESQETQVTVAIAKPFAIGRYAVTRGEYSDFVRATAHYTAGCSIWTGIEWKWQPDKSWTAPGFEQNDRHPVVCVSWDDAKAYVAWLTKTTGQPYRLPSEAEREYVTRAGTTTPFWWGAEITATRANYNGKSIYAGGGSTGVFRNGTVPVDSFEFNPFGLYNVHGNVWELTEDCWNIRWPQAFRQWIFCTY